MMSVREIQKTTDKDGNAVPVLDADGKEIEVSCIEVPLLIEAAEGTTVERQQTVDGYLTTAKAEIAAAQEATQQATQQATPNEVV